MVNPGLHSCLLASLKVAWDVSDLWESKWWAQHRRSWLQILGNWILQALGRQTPPCVCLRNAKQPQPACKAWDWCCWGQDLEYPLLGVMVSISFQVPWEPRFTQLPSRRSLWAAGCWTLCPSENSYVEEVLRIRGHSVLPSQFRECVEAQLQVTRARSLLKHVHTLT